jgi:hypothetical protein
MLLLPVALFLFFSTNDLSVQGAGVLIFLLWAVW